MLPQDDQTGTGRIRLDQLLVRRGYFESRARARDAIMRATIRVDGREITKPGHLARDDSAIEVADPAWHYVSRAAVKLIHGLDHFGLDPAGRIALDLGASTGGFTQVLLERGAKHVFAVDVGHAQFSPKLRGDPRVTLIEGLNARDLAGRHTSEIAPGFITCDVSFISLKLALPPALALASPDAGGLFLVKPQFEAGREHIGKNGIVPPEVADAVAAELHLWLDQMPGWHALGIVPSPIEGADGNREFLLAGARA